jgi:hypothetical protein
MANLKLTNIEESIVKGKRVKNSHSHNISNIKNIYQETISVNKNTASYTYLHVAEVPAVGSHDEKTMYIQAHTGRQFKSAGGGAGTGSAAITLATTIADYVTEGTLSCVATGLDLVGSDTDTIGSGATHETGKDDWVASIHASNPAIFNLPVNAAGATTHDGIHFTGNQFSIQGSTVSGEKYITHADSNPNRIKVGMRVIDSSGTYLPSDACVAKIISDTEFELDVAASATGSSKFIEFSDTIEIKLDNDLAQSASTKYKAGVQNILGAENNLTNRKSLLTSIKKSLDLWVAAGAPFTIGNITDDGTLPYLKITHTNPGPSIETREIYGYAFAQNVLFTSTRPASALATASNKNFFTNDSPTNVTLLNFSDTVTSGLVVKSSGASGGSGGGFDNDNVQYARITNNGVSEIVLFTFIDNNGMKVSAKNGSEPYWGTTTGAGSSQELYDNDNYIIHKLKPGESKVWYSPKVQVSADTMKGMRLTEIDAIQAVSESSTVEGSVEVFVASK